MADAWSIVIALWILSAFERFERCNPGAILIWRRGKGNSGWFARFPNFYPFNGAWGWIWWPLWPPGGAGFLLDGSIGGGNYPRSAAGTPLDAAQLRKQSERIAHALRGLRLWITALALFVFVLLPAVAVVRAGDGILIATGIVTLVLDLGIAINAARSARTLQGRLSRFDFARYLVYPPAALMAAVELSRARLADHDPITAAVVLAGRSIPGSWIRGQWASLHFGPTSPAAGEKLTRLRSAVQAAGLSWTQVTAPPQRTDPRCTHFCPACHVQFVVSAGHCPDCDGVPTLTFSART